MNPLPTFVGPYGTGNEDSCEPASGSAGLGGGFTRRHARCILLAQAEAADARKEGTAIGS